MKLRLLTFLVCTILAFPALVGQTQPQHVVVFISHGGGDSVGNALAYSLREQVNKSSRYVLGTEETAFFKIDLASVDINGAIKRPDGEWSAVSVVILVRTLLGSPDARPIETCWVYLTQGIEVTGKSRVDETAKEILSFFDNTYIQTTSPKAARN